MVSSRLQNLFYIGSYLLTILVVLLGALFYRQPLLSVLLLLLFLLPPLSLKISSSAVGQLTFSVTAPSEQPRVPQDIRIRIRVNNPTPFPLLNVRLKIRYRNFYNTPDPDGPAEDLVLAAEGSRTSEYTLPFLTSAAGMFLFDIEEVTATDYLHFHTYHIPFTWHEAIPVLPDEIEAPEVPLSKTATEAEDSVSSPDGELTGDLLQLRDYQPGDRLKDIHWKLTARTDEIMIKEYDRAKDLYYLLLPELSRRTAQETLKVFYAFACRLLKQKETYRVALYDPTLHTFRMETVDSEDSLAAALYLLYQFRVEQVSTAYDSLLEQFPECSGVIRFADGKVLPPAVTESY